ncbi:MAG: HPr family phosphocarrier protein [Selenomonadaceae bacterium]|nr:HPr family phosphocarrier protein [Selenomonadaceae bacterium]
MLGVNGKVVEATMTIQNRCGIHAPLATKFAEIASTFKSKIQLKAKGKTVDAKHMILIMTLVVCKGTEITIVAEGQDAEHAVAALLEFLSTVEH